ncbi:MAG TPA: DUF3192 domain-containing protein [Phycisphaerales bacterium]|nr:DUF3192 domain-containing protein [Phycisphaerales bacterium]
MRKMILICTLAVFLSGCTEEQNRKKLNRLEVGMTKAQVLEIMGEPYRREAESNSEWLLYKTETYNMLLERHKSEEERTTPLLIQNGKLIGWGNNLKQGRK